MDLVFLFNNALDALKDGGRVKVASRLARPPEVKGEGIVVEVTDTGMGIPAAILPKVSTFSWRPNNQVKRLA